MVRAAFIVDQMFEDSEFRRPYDCLREAGCEVVVIGKDPKQEITGKNGEERITPDAAIEDVSPDEFELPGSRPSWHEVAAFAH